MIPLIFAAALLAAPLAADPGPAPLVREAMERLLAHPPTLEVELVRCRETGDLVLCDAARVRAEGALFDGLTVDRGDLDFRDLSLDRAALHGERRLKVISTAEVLLDVAISEESLNRYVEFKREKIGVSRPRVRLDRGRMHLSGSFRWKLGRIDFAASGAFAVRGREIHFLPRHFEMNRMNVPSFVMKRVVREINPILDLGRLPFATRVERIAVEDGRLVISSHGAAEAKR